MDFIGINTKDSRTRIHVRAHSSTGDDLVAYGLPRHLERLPNNAENRIQRTLSNHNIEQYPEGAYIGTFASYSLEHGMIRDPDEIVSKPYPHNIELTEFPPNEGQLYKW